MADRYISFWTVLFWLPAGLLLLLVVITFTPVGRDIKEKGKCIFACIFVGLILFAIGLAGRGSRSSDAVYEARQSYNRAVSAVQALPLEGTEGLLKGCVDASIAGKDPTSGADLVRCKLVDGNTIKFVMVDR